MKAIVMVLFGLLLIATAAAQETPTAPRAPTERELTEADFPVAGEPDPATVAKPATEAAEKKRCHLRAGAVDAAGHLVRAGGAASGLLGLIGIGAAMVADIGGRIMTNASASACDQTAGTQNPAEK